MVVKPTLSLISFLYKHVYIHYSALMRLCFTFTDGSETNTKPDDSVTVLAAGGNGFKPQCGTHRLQAVYRYLLK